MARYEYECAECRVDGNTTITVIEKPIALYDREERCVTCGAVMRRVISKSSFSLKGQGWARDRYGTRKGGN